MVSIEAGPATAETDGEPIIGLRASLFTRQLEDIDCLCVSAAFGFRNPSFQKWDTP
jgi:hypothetical protein